jgi:hypothetical protein
LKAWRELPAGQSMPLTADEIGRIHRSDTKTEKTNGAGHHHGVPNFLGFSNWFSWDKRRHFPASPSGRATGTSPTGSRSPFKTEIFLGAFLSASEATCLAIITALLIAS